MRESAPLFDFSGFYNGRYAGLVSSIRRFGVPELYVEDFAQDVFAKFFAWSRTADPVNLEKPEAVLFAIARNHVTDHWWRKKRPCQLGEIQTSDGETLSRVDLLPDVGPDPCDLAARSQILQRFLQFSESHPCPVPGLTLEQTIDLLAGSTHEVDLLTPIAEAAGIKPASLRQRLRRWLEKLRELLDTDPPCPDAKGAASPYSAQIALRLALTTSQKTIRSR